MTIRTHIIHELLSDSIEGLCELRNKRLVVHIRERGISHEFRYKGLGLRPRHVVGLIEEIAHTEGWTAFKHKLVESHAGEKTIEEVIGFMNTAKHQEERLGKRETNTKRK